MLAKRDAMAFAGLRFALPAGFTTASKNLAGQERRLLLRKAERRRFRVGVTQNSEPASSLTSLCSLRVYLGVTAGASAQGWALAR